MPAVRRYAEGTKVSVESSRGELTGGGQFRLRIIRPTPDVLREEQGGDYAYPHNIDWVAKADQEWRRRWRANVLLLKAKLEFIDSGDTTLDRELLPYRVLADGRTIEEALGTGGLKLLAAGKVPA